MLPEWRKEQSRDRISDFRKTGKVEFHEHPDIRNRKSNDSKKAERFFKERGIRYQFVDLKEKGLSRGEFQSVLQAVGGLDAMIDPGCKDKDLLLLIKYIAEEDRVQKVLENQSVLKQPIVRNGRQATVGYQPDVWKGWK